MIIRSLFFFFSIILLCCKCIISQVNPITVQAVITPQSCGFGKINLTVGGDGSPFNYSWSDGSNNADLSNAVAGEHSVTIFGSNGKDTTLFFTIPLEKCKVSFPLLFTPNGDGINDTWVIHNLENHPGSIVRVFNVNGTQVFYSTTYRNEWAGNYQGSSEMLPVGSYLYQIDLGGDGTIDSQGWLYITK